MIKHFLALLLLSFTCQEIYCQDNSNIVLQYSGEAVTIRILGQNHVMWYSEKNNSMIINDYDKERYPDTKYYLVKPIVTVFKERENQNSDPDVYLRIKYYYEKFENGKDIMKEAETYENLSYNVIPPAKVETLEEASTNKIHYIVKFRGNDSDLIIENGGTNDSAIYFVYRDKNMPLSNYAIMITDVKPIIIGGKKVN